ncbi:MAG: type II toxin-antitoxin system RelE/ParE family toxin [Patescibacteria group bacterium]|nr:type II toxin-antitoxin system RelE/ParE family toxin [Patescibacteria group bacterium]
MTEKVKEKATAHDTYPRHGESMLIGYASKKLQKVCEEQRAARKELPADVAEILPRRLAQLAAFRSLGDIPVGTPLHFHLLGENLKGHCAIWIDKKYRIVFYAAGEFERLADGSPDLATVTEIIIAAVENYHKKQ